jgi:hypothetical protein
MKKELLFLRVSLLGERRRKRNAREHCKNNLHFLKKHNFEERKRIK